MSTHRAASQAWGDALLQYHGKPRTSYQASLATSHLGYSTTAYYFYHTEGATCQPSNDQSRIAAGKKNEGPCSKIKPGNPTQANRICLLNALRACSWAGKNWADTLVDVYSNPHEHF